MVNLCYPATFENGTDTRMYIDSTVYTGVTPGAPTWLTIGGETTSKISVKPKSAEGDNKDSVGGLSLPVGYDWTMSGEATWDLDDPGQVLVRAAPIALAVRRIAWRPRSATTGYYGWAMFGWDAEAPNRAIAKFSFDITGCGEILYA